MKYDYSIYVITKNKMSQDTESMSITIIKKEEYPELLERVKIFTKSDNVLIRRASFDFSILLTAAINDDNNETFEYLKDAIQHVIEYFSKELLDLINNRIEIGLTMNNVHYGLLNDISKVIIQQTLFKNKLEEVREFLAKI